LKSKRTRTISAYFQKGKPPNIHSKSQKLDLKDKSNNNLGIAKKGVLTNGMNYGYLLKH